MKDHYFELRLTPDPLATVQALATDLQNGNIQDILASFLDLNMDPRGKKNRHYPHVRRGSLRWLLQI